MNEWIENTGNRPSDLLDDEEIYVLWEDGDVEILKAKHMCWKQGTSIDCLFWKRKDQPKTLDDALGEQKIVPCEQNTMYKMPFDIEHKFPETTYGPLPPKPSQSALVASIFNLLYPELSNVREVHIEALKDIEKLVRERGGE